MIGSAGCQQALLDASYDFGAELRARSAAPASWVEPLDAFPRSCSTAHDPGGSANTGEMTPVQHGHTRGDLVLRLPAQGVPHVGGLSAIRAIPSGDADVGGWLAILNSFSQDHRRCGLPSRPATDVQAVRSLRDAFAWVRGQVENGFVEQCRSRRYRPGGGQPRRRGAIRPRRCPSYFELLVQRVSMRAWSTGASAPDVELQSSRSAGILKGGRRALARIQLMAARIGRWRAMRSSSARFAGKSTSDKPTRIVRTPCPDERQDSTIRRGSG